MGCSVPGVVRVQAVELNPEIGIVVVEKDNLPIPRKGKPTLSNERKAAVLSCDMASEGGHHRGLRSGHVLIGVARELGRAHCFLATIAGRGGLPAYQKALALTARFPAVSEPSEGIQRQGKQQGAGKRATSEATRNEQWAVLAKHNTDGQKWPGTWGTETQGTHGREGEAGHGVSLGGKTGETLSSLTVSTKLQWIAEQAFF
jgi:hypothetical protein